MTDRYAVIGNPIAHSKSPIIHAAFAEATRQALDYGAIEGPLGGFDGAVDNFRAAGGRGLNVTAPFKLDAFAYATVLHERARQAGAVNCLRFDGDRVEADNFDGIGLVRDIMVNLATPVGGRRVLMLGAAVPRAGRWRRSFRPRPPASSSRTGRGPRRSTWPRRSLASNRPVWMS